MNRNHLFGGFRHVKGRGETATGAVLGEVGRQIGGAYDQAAGAAEYAYGEVRDGYRDARRYAEHAYHDVRETAGDLFEQGSELYGEAAQRGRVYKKRVIRYTEKHPPEALLAAAGFGFLLGVILTRRPFR